MSTRTRNWMGQDIYVGSSKAIVIDNKDPDLKGRIRVNSPVFGETSFIPYIYPDDGFFSPPDIGSIVYVEADGCDPDYPIARGTDNGGNPPNVDTRSVFRRLIPTNRGWATPGDLDAQSKPKISNGGHLLELDDGIATLSGGSVVHTKASKGIRFTTSGGNFLKFWEEGSDGSGKNLIELVDSDGRTIEISKDNDRIRLRDSATSKYIDLRFTDDVIEIESSTVKIGKNAIEPIILGTSWETYHNAEIVAKLNMLIAAVTTVASSGTGYPAHTHVFSDPNSGFTGTTSGPTPNAGGALAQIPAPSAIAGPSLLAIKGKVE